MRAATALWAISPSAAAPPPVHRHRRRGLVGRPVGGHHRLPSTARATSSTSPRIHMRPPTSPARSRTRAFRLRSRRGSRTSRPWPALPRRKRTASRACGMPTVASRRGLSTTARPPSQSSTGPPWQARRTSSSCCSMIWATMTLGFARPTCRSRRRTWTRSRTTASSSPTTTWAGCARPRGQRCSRVAIRFASASGRCWAPRPTCSSPRERWPRSSRREATGVRSSGNGIWASSGGSTRPAGAASTVFTATTRARLATSPRSTATPRRTARVTLGVLSSTSTCTTTRRS